MGKLHISRLGVLRLLFLVLFSNQCSDLSNQKREQLETRSRGLWYAVRANSIYEEVLFLDSCTLSYSENSGFILREIRFSNNDSLFISSEGVLYEKFATQFKDGKMVLTSANDTTVLERLARAEKGDTVLRKLLAGDTVLIERFRDEFSSRENDWRNTFFKRDK